MINEISDETDNIQEDWWNINIPIDTDIDNIWPDQDLNELFDVLTKENHN